MSFFNASSDHIHFVHVMGNLHFSACGWKLDSLSENGPDYRCRGCYQALQYPLSRNPVYPEAIQALLRQKSASCEGLGKCAPFRSAEDYRDHLPCDCCEPQAAPLDRHLRAHVQASIDHGRNAFRKSAHCAYCGHDKTEANPSFIEQYNVLLEALVRLNIIHPETRTRLEDPAGEFNPIPRNNDWVNRIVERVIRLRVTREDEGATAIVDMGTFMEESQTFFYRCVCLRSSGTKEGPEGELV